MSTAVEIERRRWYAESRAQLEQDLHTSPAHQFPVQVELVGQSYYFDIWRGQQLPDQLLAYDVETAAIEGNEIPQLSLATVYGDQGSACFIHPGDLARFVQLHADRYFACHNATFDFWTTAQHLKADPQTCALWWDIAGDSRLVCTMLLDALIRLGRIDAEPISHDLATVAAEYCPNIQLDKADPYRLRYGELLGLSTADWLTTEPGFWSYAAKDPIATFLVAQRQFQIAQQLIEPYRKQLLPDAVRRFGPLTCCLQVQGSIALDYISRSGIAVDLAQVRELQGSIRLLVEQHQEELERLLPGCLKRYGARSKQAGQLQRTSAGVPRRDAKLIKQHLACIAEQSDEPIRPSRNQDGLVTDSVKYWAQHQELHPFIGAYVQYSQQAKLAQFFRDLRSERIYPNYRPLVRTGRTSCSRPNLQQLPRDSRFREMIVAPPGSWLLQIDYSALELRTLAQICLRRYGRSVLADLFRLGTDPHRYAAQMLLGLTAEQFSELSSAQQKEYRQKAKALSFGISGGLGAASLVSYARHSYGVDMALEEAKQFRQRLITQVYPELQAYLSDNQHATIAGNLQTSKALTRQALPKWDQIKIAQRVINGCEAAPDGDGYSPELVQHVWLLLQRLNRNPELTQGLVARQPSSTLMRRIFYRSVTTISGRLRGHVNFSQAANSPFQGLAADGNKLALFRLLRSGFQVCGFIHDEMLVLIPDGSNYHESVQHVQQILREAMQELCPDIPISTEYLLADRWYKDVDVQPTSPITGHIIPCTKPAPIYKRRTSTDPETIWSFCAPADDQPQLGEAEQET